MNAIEIKKRNKTYPGFALRDLTLTLPSGCIMGLVGENGAGKSTTIRLLLGLSRPDSGEITVLGQKMSSDLRQHIGVVLDDPGLPATFRLGAEKGRLIYGLCLGGSVALFFIVIYIMMALNIPEPRPGWWINVLIPAFMLLMLPVSWLLSVRFYEKREF